MSQHGVTGSAASVPPHNTEADGDTGSYMGSARMEDSKVVLLYNNGNDNGRYPLHNLMANALFFKDGYSARRIEARRHHRHRSRPPLLESTRSVCCLLIVH